MQDNTVIVFAGDSVTDADKANTYDRAGNGYVRLVRNYLRAFRPQEWYKVVNAGISGNTTRDLLARWDKDVAGENPDVIFCLIGINDVWRHFDGLELPVNAVGEEEFGRNMRAICEKMKGKRAFVLSPYYLERNRTDEMRAMTERYAAIARKTAEEYGFVYIDVQADFIARKTAEEYGFVYIDVQADFDEYMKSRPGQSISWDRVHPGEVGSMILARAVLRALLA